MGMANPPKCPFEYKVAGPCPCAAAGAERLAASAARTNLRIFASPQFFGLTLPDRAGEATPSPQSPPGAGHRTAQARRPPSEIGLRRQVAACLQPRGHVPDLPVGHGVAPRRHAGHLDSVPGDPAPLARP